MTLAPKADYEAELKRVAEETGVPLPPAPRPAKLKLGLGGLVSDDGNQAALLPPEQQQAPVLDWWNENSGNVAIGLGILATAGMGFWVFRLEARHAIRRLACMAAGVGMAVIPLVLIATGTSVTRLAEVGTVEVSASLGAVLFFAVLIIARAMRWVSAGIAMDRQRQADLR